MHAMNLRSIFVLIAALAFSLARIVFAQAPAPIANPNLDLRSNGFARAVVRLPDGSMVFGGNFSLVNGVERRGLAKVRADGTLDPDWNPSVVGFVEALAVDTGGNVYVGGSISSVGGLPRTHIAKLSGAGIGSVDPNWNPSADNSVEAIAIDANGDVFVGGAFLSMGGLARSYIAKLSGSGVGAVDANWNPGADNQVRTLVIDGSGNVYAGGWFGVIGGQARMRLAKLSASGSGAADAAWNPSPNGIVDSLAFDGVSSIYVGGFFTDIGGQDRANIAKVTTVGVGAADPAWNPSSNSLVRAIAVDGSGHVFVGGDFTVIGGFVRSRIAKLSAGGAGIADANWNPQVDDTVQEVAIGSDGSIYTGGLFTQIDGQVRVGLARLDEDSAATGFPIDTELNGQVFALARNPDGSIIVGGNFERANSQPRRNILRLQANGTLDPTWSPSANGVVDEVAVDGVGNVYASGQFTIIGGQTRQYIAKLTSNGAADASWNPFVDGYVRKIIIDNIGDVYVGGWFTTIGGQARANIAKLSGMTGEVDPDWNPSANSGVSTLAIDSIGNLFAGGDFSSIGGQARQGIAKLSSSGAGGADAAWNPSPNGSVFAIAIDDNDDIYVGGYFSLIGGGVHQSIARLGNAGAGAADPTWTPSVQLFIRSLALNDEGSIYAGGSLTSANGQPLQHLAKFSKVGSGALDANWNPEPNDQVFDLAIDANDNLIVGGWFTEIGGHARTGLAAMPQQNNTIFRNGFE